MAVGESKPARPKKAYLIKRSPAPLHRKLITPELILVERGFFYTQVLTKQLRISPINKRESIPAAFDSLFGEAVELVRKTNSSSISGLQRALRINYVRASGLLEEMENQKIISKPDEVGRRTVLR